MLIAALALALGMVQRDWFAFEPEGKDYRVAFPGKPDGTTSRTVNNAAGRSRVSTTELKTPGATYSFQVTEGQARIRPETLDDGIRRYGEIRRAEIGPVATISVDGQPGREFEMTEGSGGGKKSSRMRWVVSDKSLYILGFTPTSADTPAADGDRFLGSFEIGVAKKREQARARFELPLDDVAKAEAPPGKPALPRESARDEFLVGEPAGKEAMTDADVDEGKAKADVGQAKAEPRTSAKKPTVLTRVTISRVPRDAKKYPSDRLVDLPRSFAERDRDAFRDLGPEGSVLVGVRVSYIERFGGPKIRSVQPIYRSGKSHYQGQVFGDPVGPFATFVASPGYAVGGLVTHSGLMLDGFGIVFMRVEGDRLVPDDAYKSPWIGDKQGGGPDEATSPGGWVVGLQGRAGGEVKSLGLTTLK